MQASIRFLQILHSRIAPAAPSGAALTFAGAGLTFGGAPLTFQPA